jgi:hypothetical protein
MYTPTCVTLKSEWFILRMYDNILPDDHFGGKYNRSAPVRERQRYPAPEAMFGPPPPLVSCSRRRARRKAGLSLRNVPLNSPATLYQNKPNR